MTVWGERQWTKFELFILHQPLQGDGVPLCVSKAMTSSEPSIISSSSCKVTLASPLRCTNKAGRFSVNHKVLQSLFFPFITVHQPHLHVWLSICTEAGKRGASKLGNKSSLHLPPALTPVNQLWPPLSNLTGQSWPHLSPCFHHWH